MSSTCPESGVVGAAGSATGSLLLEGQVVRQPRRKGRSIRRRDGGRSTLVRRMLRPYGRRRRQVAAEDGVHPRDVEPGALVVGTGAAGLAEPREAVALLA